MEQQQPSSAKTVILSGMTAAAVSVFVVALAGTGAIPAAPPPPRAGTGVVVDPGDPFVREESIIRTVQYAEPAVVSVIITKDLPIVERYYEDPFGGDPFFSPFPFRIPQFREQGTERREIGGGTAFFISPDGLLMTNRHVVADEEAEYTVLMNDGSMQEARVVARDPGNDIALLQVEGEDFPYLSFSDADAVLGQSVVAIGNALAEFRNTVSVGVVSGLSRSVMAGSPTANTVERLQSVIQTDAAINQGNSGGPLLNLRGEVVGMNTAIALDAQNVGFAIPAEDLRSAIENFRQHGRIIRPFLGVRYIVINERLARQESLPVHNGALIRGGGTPQEPAIVPRSPADAAGLRGNDIILEVDGTPLDHRVSLVDIIRRRSPGDEVRLRVLRGDEEIEVTVTLREQEQE